MITNAKIRKPRKSKKYFFVLKNINAEKIETKYNISMTNNILLQNNEIPPDKNVTKITELSDLNKDSSLEIVSFLDETKRLYRCNVSMIDFKTGLETNELKYNCFWCRHAFTTNPIGCPIKYVSNKANKQYFSEVTKDNYVIKENITKNKRLFLEKNSGFIFLPNKLEKKNYQNTNISVNRNEFFTTDGIFCSFNCCKAFIKDNKHNVLYDHSNFLLSKLYNDMIHNGTGDISNVIINSAPHWRLLKEYGGDLTIQEFREKFNKTKYEYQGNILFKPLGYLFEEKINF